VITIELPKTLCSASDTQSTIEVDDSHKTVGEALSALADRSPHAFDSVMDEQGNVRRHVNVFLNGESIRYLKGLDTPAPSGSAILIITAISGG
jgi:molybdopterin synthase sulfur carrier subunit